MSFKTRGPLNAQDHVPYLARQADKDLPQLLTQVDYVALIGPRLSGKTSMLTHLWERFSPLPRFVMAYINLSRYQTLDEARWYAAMVAELVASAGGALPPAPNVEDAIDFREALLLWLKAYIPDRVLVILFDDVETVPISMGTSLFATLREMFVSRGVEPALRRLSFVLAGSYIPDELIPDPTISPFRVAEKVYVEDAEDISPLVRQLESPEHPLSPDVGARIMEWTEGDVYLTQRLCERLAQRYAQGAITPAAVDQIVERYLLDDDTFDNLEQRLRGQPRVLNVIHDVVSRETTLRFSRTNRVLAHAWLLGCIKPNSYGNCIARNAIYHQVLEQLLGRMETQMQNTHFSPSPKPARPSEEPQVLRGRYSLEGVIRRGMMSHVYRARDLQSGQLVVVKQLLSMRGGDLIAWRRFQREGEALRLLDHPHIVKLYETFREGDYSYIVMEYVNGGSLDAMLNREGRQPVPLMVRIMLAVADALHYTHQQHIIHRDIKPSNILLTQDYSPRLADFGVAHFAQQAERLTATYAIVGTPAYIPPEGYDNASFSPAEDVWALGVTLYEMLTGMLPFNGRTHEHIRYAVQNDPVPDVRALRPDVPDALAGVLQKMICRDLGQRLADGQAVKAALGALPKD
jgi:hypothetical protein